MDFSIGNLNGTNASISSMISQLVAQRTTSLDSLLSQKSAIENSLSALGGMAYGGSLNSSYSSQIASLQDTIDRLKSQYTINTNKLTTVNSLNNSYKKTVSTLDDYLESLKNPNSTGINLSATSSNTDVADVTLTGTPNPQRIDLTVTQLATCSTLTSGKIQGSSVTGSTKITDIFASAYDSANNTVFSSRVDIKENTTLSSLGITSGAFKLGSRIIRVNAVETVGDVIDKINADSNYTAAIDSSSGSFSIKANNGSSVAITNAVGNLNISGDLTLTTKLADLGVKSGTYFVGDAQIDVASDDTIGVLIDKIEASGYTASLQTDVNNPSAKMLNITDGSGNSVSTEATNFAAVAGFTVSTGTFSINGETFTIDTNTTIDDLILQINTATADGVGAQLKDGKIILTASETGAVEINVEKGTSNFTNAIGLSAGGLMNKGSFVMGSEGAYATLKGQTNTIALTDIAKADGTGQFTAGTFSITYSQIDTNGNFTGSALTTEISIQDGDTIANIIEKIKTQTTQTYTDASGSTKTNYIQGEIVNGSFQLRQSEKGSGYTISVNKGTSDFTNYVGMTQGSGEAVATPGTSTTFTGVNSVTESMTFSDGTFSITASKANDPSTTQTIDFDVTDKNLATVIQDINESGLAITAQIVDNKLQLKHNNYGGGYTISIAAGSSDFTGKVGFTASATTTTSNTASYSTLTGIASGLSGTDTGYTDGAFVIKTNKLSEDGKTASNEIVSAIIEVSSSMTLNDVMTAINNATYKDTEGNDISLGLEATIVDSKLQIRQKNAGEGFDIEIEAGDTNFTTQVGLTATVNNGTFVSGGTFTTLTSPTEYNGTFTAGSFVISTNKINPDGSASDEMISKEITIEANKTLEEQIDSINSQLGEIGLSASIVDGKLQITQTNSGASFDIQVEAGDTDFTEKLGLTTAVSNGVSTPATYAYLQGSVVWNEDPSIYFTKGNFTVSANNVLSYSPEQMHSVTVNVDGEAGTILSSINSQVASIGLRAELIDGKLTFIQQNAGAGYNITVTAGTSNITEVLGLLATTSTGVSSTASVTKLQPSLEFEDIDDTAEAGVDFTAGTFTITVTDPYGSKTKETITITNGENINDILNNITNNENLGIKAYLDANNAIVLESQNAGPYTIDIEAGTSNFTEYVGLTTEVIIGEATLGTAAKITGTTNLNDLSTVNSVITTTKTINLSARQTVDYSTGNNVAIVVTKDGEVEKNLTWSSSSAGQQLSVTLAGLSSYLNNQGVNNEIKFTADGRMQIILDSGYDICFEDLSGNLAEFTGLETIKKTEAEIDAIGGYIKVYDEQGLINALSAANNNPSAKIILMNNITVSDQNAVGCVSVFTGILDGNGYALTLNNLDGGTLIGEIDGGTVKNLKISGRIYNSAGFIANVVNNGTIKNIFVDGIMDGAAAYSGMIAGIVTNSVLDNITGSCRQNIQSDFSSGMIVGQLTDSQLTNFYVSGTLSPSSTGSDWTQDPTRSGAIAGTVTDSTIKNGHIGFLATDLEYIGLTGSISGTDGGTTISDITIRTNNRIDRPSTSGSCESNFENIFFEAEDQDAYNEYLVSRANGSFFGVNTAPVSSSILNGSQDQTSTLNNFAGTIYIEGPYGITQITFEDTDTLEQALEKINDSDVIASIDEATGNLIIESEIIGEAQTIKVYSGTSKFLELAGITSAVENIGILTNATEAEQFSTLTGANNVTSTTAISAGTIKINGQTVTIQSNTTLENAINSINEQIDGISVSINNDKVVFKSESTGVNNIEIKAGTSDFGVITGLTNELYNPVSLGSDGSKTSIIGSQTIKTHMTAEEATALGYTVIYNPNQLVSLMNSNRTGKFMLIQDIDMSSVQNAQVSNFYGTLDGNGYSIKNFSSTQGGLFNTLGNTSQRATIKNITFENANISSTASNTGVLANMITGQVELDDVNILNATVAGGTYTGGLVGYAQYTGNTTNSVLNANNIDIKDLNISGTTYVGGLLGYNGSYQTTVTNAYIDMTLTQSVAYVGGITSMGNTTGTINVADSYIKANAANGVSNTQSGAIAAGAKANLVNIYLNSNFKAPVLFQKLTGSSDTHVFYNEANAQQTTSTTGVTGLFSEDILLEKAKSSLSIMDYVEEDYTTISAGTISINGTSITLSEGDIVSALSQINAKSSTTGVTASLVNNKVVFSSYSGITIADGTSDFVEKTGIANYTAAAPTTQTLSTTISATYSTNRIDTNNGVNATKVTTADELITALTNNENVVLMNDIDLSSVDATTVNIENYSGIFEGNGYTLFDYSGYKGLIASTEAGAVFKNFTINSFSITGNDNSPSGIGGLVDIAYDDISFENIYILDTSVKIGGNSNPVDIGGLVGAIDNGIANFENITYTTTRVVITGDARGVGDVGGLVGSSTAELNIFKNITTHQFISGNSYYNIGGLAGLVTGDTIITNAVVGGRMGTSSITESHTTVNGIGGLIGHSRGLTTINDTVVNTDFTSIYTHGGSNFDALVGTGSIATVIPGQILPSITKSEANVVANNVQYTDTEMGGAAITVTSLWGAATTTADESITGATYTAGAYKTQLTETEATNKGYICIHSGEELLAAINANQTAKLILMNDIDLTGFTSSTWCPQEFGGILDGNGYSIKNLTATSTGYIGLFSKTQDGAEIRNLTINNFNLTTSRSYGSLLVGMAQGDIVVENITIKNSSLTTTSGSVGLGALIGDAKGSITLDNIDIQDTVTISGALVGGAVARTAGTRKTLLATDVKMAATLSGTRYLGGLIGINQIQNTYASNIYIGGVMNCTGNPVNGLFATTSGTVNVSNIYVNATTSTEYGFVITSECGGQIKHNNVHSYYKDGNSVDWTYLYYGASSLACTTTTDTNIFTDAENKIDADPYKRFRNTPISIIGINGTATIITQTDWTINDFANAVNNSGTGAIMKYDGTSWTMQGIVGMAQISATYYDLNISSTDVSNVNSNITKRLVSSQKGLTLDTVLAGQTAGNFVFTGEGDRSTTVSITATDTIGDIINKINANPGIKSGLDNEGRFYLERTDSTVSAVTAGNSRAFSTFNKLVGLTNSLIIRNNATTTEQVLLRGTVNVTGTETLSAGSIVVSIGSNSAQIDIAQNSTINTVLNQIKSSGLNLDAFIEDDKVVLLSNSTTNTDSIELKNVSGDFGVLTGLATQTNYFNGFYTNKTTGIGTKPTLDMAVSAGEFHIVFNGEAKKITVAENSTMSDVIDTINTVWNGKLTAMINGDYFIIGDVNSTGSPIIVTDGTSNFADLAGFATGGFQSQTTDLGANATLTSANTVASVSDGTLTEGTFFIQTFDKNGAYTGETRIIVYNTDTIESIVERINYNLNPEFNAYIDQDSNKVVIERTSQNEAGTMQVVKGTSNFTDLIGFTSGGEQIVETQAGTNTQITSTNTTTGKVFTEGTFEIQITNLQNGNTMVTRLINVEESDTVETIAEKIKTTLAFLNAYIDEDTDKLVIETEQSNIGFNINKGTSDFTTVLGLTSGGEANPNNTTTVGTIAEMRSNEVQEVDSVTAGNFFIQLTGENASVSPIEITIAENSSISDVIQAINSQNLGVTAHYDNATNQIVITRDADKGAGGFEIISGTSNFTNFAGFTVGGATFVQGCNPILSSISGLDPNTEVSAGDFIIEFTRVSGGKATFSFTVEEGDTIATVLDKINTQTGGNATFEWNNSHTQFSICCAMPDVFTSFEIKKGTSNFTTITGLTSGGEMLEGNTTAGSNPVANSTITVAPETTFSKGDFKINVDGIEVGTVNVEDRDTILDIVDKINEIDDIEANYDEDTGILSITSTTTGLGNIEIIKGSSNFTNEIGLTSGGSTNAIYTEGETAQITSPNAVTPSQEFTEGNFTIKLTNEDGTTEELLVEIADKSNIADVAQAINDLNANVYAEVIDNKLVIKKDADSGAGNIEIIAGSSNVTTELGLTIGGEQQGSTILGETSKITSINTAASVDGTFTSGNFKIQLLDNAGNNEGSAITVTINETAGVVDNTAQIVETINNLNAGVTASIDNITGKLVIERNETLSAGSLKIIEGSTDFTSKIGITEGGGDVISEFEDGDFATYSSLSSTDLSEKLVSSAMTLGSIGVTNGSFKINGVEIQVKTTDNIYDLVSRINNVFSDPKYSDIAITASYENGEIVLRTQNSSSEINVEKGSTNFTDIAQLTKKYYNSSDLNIINQGKNAKFNMNGTDYDMSLTTNVNGENILYLDKNGNIVNSVEDSAVQINIKDVGHTVIDIGRDILDDNVRKLQTFINRFNTAMKSSQNTILSDDTSFVALVNKIKSALKDDVGSQGNIAYQLDLIGISLEVTDNGNAAPFIQMTLTKTDGEYDYVNAFYQNPQKIFDILIGNDAQPISWPTAGVFTRLHDVMENSIKNTSNGYFKVTPRVLDTQQKALKNEITSLTFDLNELKASNTGGYNDGGSTEMLALLEQQYQLINQAIASLNKQYSSSLARLVLNQNNSSFNPLVS